MARTRRLASLLAIAGACARSENAAFAQTPDAPSVTREAAAQALFDEGKQLLADGNVTLACQRFLASQRMDPGAGTALNLADCYEQAGKLASAWTVFKSAGADARRNARPQWAVIADRRAALVEPRVPRIVMRLAPQEANVAIELDGETVASEAVGSRMPVDPGTHKLVAKANGRVTFERSLDAREGNVETIDIPTLIAVTAPEPAARPSPVSSGTGWERVGGISATGVAAVGIGLGVFFGLTALSKNAEAARLCPTDRCSSQAPVDLTDEARTARTESIVSFSAAAVLAAAGVTLLVVSTHQGARVTPTAAVDRQGGTLGIRGTF